MDLVKYMGSGVWCKAKIHGWPAWQYMEKDVGKGKEIRFWDGGKLAELRGVTSECERDATAKSEMLAFDIM